MSELGRLADARLASYRLINGGQQPASYDRQLSSAPATATSTPTGKRIYTDPLADIRPSLQPYFDRVDATDPNSLDLLENLFKTEGVEYQRKGDLFKFGDHDYGWIDLRKDQAYLQNRRGPESMAWTVQPWYGREDRDRLLAQGRHPDTGEPLNGAAYTGGESVLGGGFGGLTPRARPMRTPPSGRRSTIYAGFTPKPPSIRRTVLGGF